MATTATKSMTLAERLKMWATYAEKDCLVRMSAQDLWSAAAIVEAAERWTRARAELSKIQATGHGYNYSMSSEEHTRLMFTAEGEADRAEQATAAALAAAGTLHE